MNNVTPEYCLDIIQKFEVSEENKKQNVLGIEGKSFDVRVSFVLLHCSGVEVLWWCFGEAFAVCLWHKVPWISSWECGCIFVSWGEMWVGGVRQQLSSHPSQPSSRSGDGCLRLWGFIARSVFVRQAQTVLCHVVYVIACSQWGNESQVFILPSLWRSGILHNPLIHLYFCEIKYG